MPTPTTQIDIPRKTAESLVSFLSLLLSHPSMRHEAADLIRDMTDALERDTSPTNPTSIASELLEAIGRASGRTLSTTPSLHALRSAREALAELAPTLGAPVIQMPRAVHPNTKSDIAAEVSRQIEELQRPITLIVQERGMPPGEAESVAVVPRIREAVLVHGEMMRVVDVQHCGTHVIVIVEAQP